MQHVRRCGSSFSIAITDQQRGSAGSGLRITSTIRPRTSGRSSASTWRRTCARRANRATTSTAPAARAVVARALGVRRAPIQAKAPPTTASRPIDVQDRTPRIASRTGSVTIAPATSARRPTAHGAGRDRGAPQQPQPGLEDEHGVAVHPARSTGSKGGCRRLFQESASRWLASAAPPSSASRRRCGGASRRTAGTSAASAARASARPIRPTTVCVCPRWWSRFPSGSG